MEIQISTFYFQLTTIVIAFLESSKSEIKKRVLVSGLVEGNSFRVLLAHLHSKIHGVPPPPSQLMNKDVTLLRFSKIIIKLKRKLFCFARVLGYQTKTQVRDFIQIKLISFNFKANGSMNQNALKYKYYETDFQLRILPKFVGMF